MENEGIGTSGEAIVRSGQVLQKTQTQFTTAVAIQKPRDRKNVIRLCEEEAAIAADEFFYSWTVKGNKGNQLVEGLSVSASLAAARNWGNCAIPCEVEDTEDAYIFTATFLDMETGFNLQRVFRQRKKINIGMKDVDRAEDITFQIGQSKALRNVILNALPSWLLSKMLVKAKEDVISKILKMGLDVARKKTVDFFSRYSVTPERIEAKIGKKIDKLAAEDLAILQGAMNTLLNGQESAESLFPSSPTNEVKPQTKSDTVQPTKPSPDEDVSMVVGKIADIITKKGNKNGKDWQSWIVCIDGDKYGTFSQSIADTAMIGSIAEVTYKVGKFGNEIVSLKKIIQEERQPGDES